MMKEIVNPRARVGHRHRCATTATSTDSGSHKALPIGSRARLAEALAGRAAAFQESGAIRVESIFFVGRSESVVEGCEISYGKKSSVPRGGQSIPHSYQTSRYSGHSGNPLSAERPACL